MWSGSTIQRTFWRRLAVAKPENLVHIVARYACRYNFARSNLSYRQIKKAR